MRDISAADAALTEVFGIGVHGLRRGGNKELGIPDAIFDMFLKVIESSGAIELIAQWQREDSPSNAGAKAHLSSKAVLLAMLMNSFRGSGYSNAAIAATICDIFTPAQAARLDFTHDTEDVEVWYHRSWRTLHRTTRLFDPWHLAPGLRNKLTGKQHADAVTVYDPSREVRAHQLASVLVKASLTVLPKKYLANYRGDVALDSTAIKVMGRSNPNNAKRKKKLKMNNGDYQCGWCVRDGDHDGSNSKTASPSYELDTTVMVDTKDGCFEFSLVTGIAFHLPGALRVGPRFALDEHAASTDKRGILIVDRAFNNLKPEYFQEHVRRHRLETLYNYRTNQLGPQGSVPGKPVIIVDGVPHVNRMPESYIMISRWHAEGVIDPGTNEPYTEATRDEIMQARTVYQLKAKGHIDSDGHQRFSYPNPRGYIAFDPTTGAPTKDQPTGSVMLKLAPETIKHLQKYPWMSADWHRANGQRNQVETSNKRLKDSRNIRLGDEAARPGRGYANQFLAAMIATVASNIRRIITGITNVNTLNKDGKPKQRARKRRDSTGNRLSRTNTTTTSTTTNIPDETPPPQL